MRVLSLFDGIGSGRLVLDQLGVQVSCYHASEVDPYAIKVARANFPDIHHLGDVREVFPKKGDYDLVLAAPPCQGFSPAGLRKGLSDPRSGLLLDAVRILRDAAPRYFFVENSWLSDDRRRGLDDLFQVPGELVNSAWVSCQNRKRTYWTNIPHTPLSSAMTPSAPVLQDVVGPYLGIYVYPRGKAGGLSFYKGKCPTLTASSWYGNFKLQVTPTIQRQFTPEEAEQIQGLPVGYTSLVSKTQRFRLIGNGWSIPTISLLMAGLRDTELPFTVKG